MGRFKRNRKRTARTAILSKKVQKPIKKSNAPLYSELYKDVALSLKRRKKFGSFINGYMPPSDCLENDLNWENRLYAERRVRTYLKIGEIKYGTTPLKHMPNPLFSSLIKRLLVLETTLHKKHDTEFGIGDVLTAYATDEIPKLNKKIYPNEMVFTFTLGSIFAGIGMVMIITILSLMLYQAFAIVISLMWTIFLGVFWWGLRNNLLSYEN